MKKFSFPKAFSLIIGILMLLSLCSCTIVPVDSSGVSISEKAVPIYPDDTDLKAHYYNETNLQKVSESGLISLLRDPISASLAIVVKNSFADSAKTWTALPKSDSEAYTSDEADVFNLEVIHKGKLYSLNSQDNSVSYGFVTWGATKTGFRTVYLVTNNKLCVDSVGFQADDKELKKAAADDILFRITLDYIVSDGCLYASLRHENLGAQDDVISKIGFLEFFGAKTTAEKDDCIFIPDGCGAVITTASSEEMKPVSVAVYGNDLGGSTELSAVMPAYGFKDGSDSFAAVIEKGDAVAEITACKAPFGSNYNHVGASFTITPSETKNGKVCFSKFSYADELKICFRFLSGSNSDYSGMAAACREQFIRNFTLSTRTIAPENDLPVLVTAVGCSAPNGVLRHKKTLTTFDEAEDILTRVKTKGVNNIYIRCTGFTSGGLNPDYAMKAEPLLKLGGFSGLKSLNDYATGQNFNVFLDVDMISGSKSDRYNAVNLFGRSVQISSETVLNDMGLKAEEQTRYFKSWSNAETALLKVLERYDDYSSVGFCLADVGASLFTDFGRGSTRQTIAESANDIIAPLSVRKLVMVCKGNFYSLKNADVIANMPMSTGKEQSGSYTAVPFLQIVLHGIVDYGSENLNLGSSSSDAFLHSIEYGAVPSFVLTDRSYDDSKSYGEKFFADNSMPVILECYEQSSQALADLRGARITSHYEVANGVFCTEYEATTRIYVNYTDSAFSVNGITVEGHSWFRAN